MESINQRENFQSIERLYMKMKEENKKEIMIINENFKRIEESCSNFSSKDINLIMNNYKNMINLNMHRRNTGETPATAADSKYKDYCTRLDESIINYSQWFKLSFSNLLNWISTKNMQNLEETEILEFLKDVNDNMVDEYKNDIQNASEKVDKSDNQIHTEQLDDYKSKEDHYNKSYNMDERYRKSYNTKRGGGKAIATTTTKQTYNKYKESSNNNSYFNNQ
jgi:hypothetical protein